MNKIINKIKRSLDFTKNQVSYSQLGEDLILKHIFTKDKGFYVDIGAYDPKLYSNTALLYQKGWTGINIEPITKKYLLFVKQRKKDINLNCGISLNPGTNTIYENKAESSFLNNKKGTPQVINTFTLKEVLDKYLPLNQEIDFFDIDVEGMDLDVLLSNDWKKYRPKIILVENNVNCVEINDFLLSVGYFHKYQLLITGIYFREDF